jgi:pimeloyl-ACP methyl ester carboxylesterase
VPRIQPANVHILEDVGHVPHLEAPEVCGKLILEFSKTL